MLRMLRGKDTLWGNSREGFGALQPPALPQKRQARPAAKGDNSHSSTASLQRSLAPLSLGGVDADRAVTVATAFEKPTALNCGGLLVRNSGHVERVHDPVALSLLYYCFLPLIASFASADAWWYLCCLIYCKASDISHIYRLTVISASIYSSHRVLPIAIRSKKYCFTQHLP